MVSGRAVVVGYDGSPASAAAARWAATEAALQGLPLRVVHVPARLARSSGSHSSGGDDAAGARTPCG